MPVGPASPVFVSYRREDSAAFVGRLCDRLRAGLGPASVAVDVDSIPLGADYRAAIDDLLNRCSVVLAVMGNAWAGPQRDGTRKIDRPDDVLRVELETALARGRKIIPLLVGQATTPQAADLPPVLVDLSYRNGMRIDPGPDFHHHVDLLLRALAAEGEPSSASQPRDQLAPPDGQMARIEQVSGSEMGQSFSLVNDRVLIGRAASCDISLPYSFVTNFHAQLVRTEEGFAVEDVGSKNGTYVNGKRLPFGTRLPLKDGDRIHVGQVIFVYHGAGAARG